MMCHDQSISNLKKQTLEIEIRNLINIRNNYIDNAVNNALALAEDEMQENIIYSLAAIVINSIVSFITNINSFGLSFRNRLDLSKLSMRFSRFDFRMPQLKKALDDLKLVCGVV